MARFHHEFEAAVRAMFALADRYGIPPEEVDAEFERLPTRGLVLEAAA